MDVVEGEVIDEGGKKRHSRKKELFIHLSQKYWFWLVFVILIILFIFGFIIFGTVLFYERLIFILFKTPWNPYLVAAAIFWIATAVLSNQLKKMANFWQLRSSIIILIVLLTFLHYGFVDGLLYTSVIFIITTLIKSLINPRRLGKSLRRA